MLPLEVHQLMQRVFRVHFEMDGRIGSGVWLRVERSRGEQISKVVSGFVEGFMKSRRSNLYICHIG